VSYPNPAAQALIEALKDPLLSDQQRLALVSALQAVTGSASTTGPPPPRPPAASLEPGARLI